MGSAPTIGGVFVGQATQLDFDMPDNTANAFLLRQGVNDYLAVDTVDNVEAMRFGETGVMGLIFNFNLKDEIQTAFALKESGREYFAIDTRASLEGMQFGFGGALSYNFLLRDNTTAFGLINSAGALYYYKINTANAGEQHSWDGDGPGASYAYRLADDRADALIIAEGAAGVNEYYRLRTTNAGERQDWSLCEFVFNLKDNIASAFRLTEAGNIFLEVKTSNGTEGIKLGTAGGTLGFYASFGVVKQTINGSRALPEQALKDLLAKLALTGILIDNTSA